MWIETKPDAVYMQLNDFVLVTKRLQKPDSRASVLDL